jgi:hypothetical protein
MKTTKAPGRHSRRVGVDCVAGGRAFIETVEALKKRHGGGVDGFDPAPAVIQPQDPFQTRRRK